MIGKRFFGHVIWGECPPLPSMCPTMKAKCQKCIPSIDSLIIKLVSKFRKLLGNHGARNILSDYLWDRSNKVTKHLKIRLPFIFGELLNEEVTTGLGSCLDILNLCLQIVFVWSNAFNVCTAGIFLCQVSYHLQGAYSHQLCKVECIRNPIGSLCGSDIELLNLCELFNTLVPLT